MIASESAMVGGAVASRTGGVAPLSVFFDAQGIDGLLPGEAQDAEYLWSFGDSDAPFDATGFFVAHVYREPGTYTVRLQVRASNGRMLAGAVAVVEVLAEPPGGWATYYVSTSGDDAHVGDSPAAPLQTLRRALALLRPGVRVLLRRGDTWDGVRGLAVDRVAGPAMIGAYGDPDAPPPVVRHPAADAAYAPPILFRRCADFRVVGLAIEGNALGGPYPAGYLCHGIRAHACPEFLALDCEIRRTGNAVFYYRDSPRMAVAGCLIDECVGYGAYGNNVLALAFMGNEISRLDGNQHGVRVQHGRNAYVAGNRFARARKAKDAFTFRGGLAGVVFAGNASDLAVALSPHEGLCVSRIVVERNELTSLSIDTAYDVSVRNNRTGPIQLRRTPALGAPGNVALYSNTCLAREHVILSQLDAAAMRANGIRIVDNAIVIDPAAPGWYRWPYDADPYAGIVFANYVYDRRGTAPSPFLSLSPDDPGYLVPLAEGALASAGVPTHLAIDLDGRTRLRSAGRVIGARVPRDRRGTRDEGVPIDPFDPGPDSPPGPIVTY